jgi:hypothetical protein
MSLLFAAANSQRLGDASTERVEIAEALDGGPRVKHSSEISVYDRLACSLNPAAGQPGPRR